MKEVIQKMKVDIKLSAEELRSLNSKLRQPHKLPEAATLQWNRHVHRANHRHLLLAYGLLRGKTVSQMECKSRTAPTWCELQSQLKKYVEDASVIEQIIRNFAEQTSTTVPGGAVGARSSTVAA